MKKRGQGREALIEAARLEFEDHGFEGTNSNVIARRAGYAPQTFYRHFEDKRAVFLAVYQAWATAEARDLSVADSAEAVADALIRHHKTHRVFRQSLRALTVSDPEVGQARASARQAQMLALAARTGLTHPARCLTAIFNIERVSDAIADGEFQACGVSEERAREELIAVISNLFDAGLR